MKYDRRTLEAIQYFHTKMKADATLRAAFDTIMEYEIDSRYAILATCNPNDATVVSAAQDRIKFAESIKKHEDLIKSSTQALSRLAGD